MVRGWRATLEERLAQTQATCERLSILAKEVAGLPRIRTELIAVQRQIAQKEQALKVVEDKRLTVELAVQRADKRLTEITTKRAEVQNRAALLAWVRDTQPRYARLRARQQELNAELQRSTDALGQLQAAQERATATLRKHETAAAQVAEQLKVRRDELAAAQALVEAIPAWQANRARWAALRQAEQDQIKALELLRGEGREVEPRLAAIRGEEMPLARRVADAETSQSELRTLVSQLQSHVVMGACPLCGQDHGSRDQLPQRIQKHAAADAASGARAHLTAIRERAKALLERVAVNKQKQESAESQITSLKHDYRRLETEIGQFTAAASKLALAVESAGPSLAEQAQAVITRRQQEVAQLGKLAQETATAILDAAGIAVANAKRGGCSQESRGRRTEGRAVALAGGTEPLTLGPSVDPVSLWTASPARLPSLRSSTLRNLTSSRPRRRKRRLKPTRRNRN